MARFRPGIPQGFDLNVPPVKPVADLGDYLDEPGASPVRPVNAPGPVPVAPSPVPPAARPAPTFVERAVVPEPAVGMPSGRIPAARPSVPAPGIEPAREPSADEPLGISQGKAPRREISMTPETLRMSDELLEMIRSATGQRDAKANELFHAAILLLYEVRGELDLHRVPRRGRWGTPTARAFPVAIKGAFHEAILERARND